MSFLCVPLDSSHKKDSFSCGKVLLDNYIHIQAKQDVKKRVSACFVMPSENGSLKGYYTLSSASIPRNVLPENIIKKLPPSYTDLPVTLLGRLAIDKNYQGQGMGEMLLLDALKRCYSVSSNVASLAVIVDPIDEGAKKFYEMYGFISLPDSGKMFLTMKTITDLFSDK